MRRRVLVFGTFDLLHAGHIHFLQAAARLGDVTVALTTDQLCNRYKGFLPTHGFHRRRTRLSLLGIVREVIAADDLANSYRVLRVVQPHDILLGYDQGQQRSIIEDRLRAYGLSARILVAKPYRNDVYRSSFFRNAAVELAHRSAA